MSAQAKRSLGARRGRAYDKGRGALMQVLWVATATLIFKKVWCPNQFRITLLRCFGAEIGTGVLVRHNVNVQWPWKLAIGDNSWIGTGADLYNVDRITIGSDVCISQEAFLCTGSHDRDSPTFEYDNAPIVIENGTWVCARAMILRGVTVGPNSVVGAMCLVSSDLPADSVTQAPATAVLRR
jgi:putative colanic acid biosynthesis acetyltransferase WcaF